MAILKSNPYLPCSDTSCTRKAVRRGMCHKHYMRLRRAGSLPSTYLVSGSSTDPFERFASKVRVEDECWVWTGASTKNGYGLFTMGSKSVRAHRFSYEHYIGQIPEGLVIDHLCRNRACVNPMHLEAVTQFENSLRGLQGAQIFHNTLIGYDHTTCPPAACKFAGVNYEH